MRKISVFLFAAGLVFCRPALAADPGVNLEKITVDKTGSDTTGTVSINNSLSLSPEEAPADLSEVDLRRRSAYGVQQDVSLRGSIFEDVGVSLCGAPLNDPQTGHFNLELPVTSADLAAVTVDSNRQQLAYVLKAPQKSGSTAGVDIGEYQFKRGLVSMNFPLNEVLSRFSAEYKSSSGARPDTDFKISTLSLDSVQKNQDSSLEFLAGYTHRDFGADSFYSSQFTQEEEHTNQMFFSLKEETSKDEGKLTSQLYLRRHEDEFILDRHDPDFYRNDSTGMVYGLSSAYRLENSFYVGGGWERQKLSSTSLDDNSRDKEGLSVGLKDYKTGKASFTVLAGLDHMKGFKSVKTGSAQVKYPFSDSFTGRFAYDRLWRAPSFTELYYHDPANIGNKDLLLQKSDNYEAGLDWKSGSLGAGFDLFDRGQKNTIDWVKDDLLSPWTAANVGKVDSKGADVYAGFRPRTEFFKFLKASYTYLTLDRGNPYLFSKYVFDYQRQRAVMDAGFSFFKQTSLTLGASFNKPVQRKFYPVFDLALSQPINSWTITLECVNIFDRDYQEIAGIPGTPRWYKGSVTLKF